MRMRIAARYMPMSEKFFAALALKYRKDGGRAWFRRGCTMSRESEFLTRHRDDLKRGAELCRLLQGNMVEARPREKHYLELRLICKRLEGTSRQMAHERGDDFTWLQLGH